MIYDLSKVTLDLAQLLALAGLIWSLAKMSAAVDSLKTVTGKLTVELERIGTTLLDMVTRVRVLEDRGERRRQSDLS